MMVLDAAHDRNGDEVLRGDTVHVLSSRPVDAAKVRTVCGIHSVSDRVTVLFTDGLIVRASDVLLTSAE